MPNKFVAIDFETANADLASICQVGVVSPIGYNSFTRSGFNLHHPGSWGILTKVTATALSGRVARGGVCVVRSTGQVDYLVAGADNQLGCCERVSSRQGLAEFRKRMEHPVRQSVSARASKWPAHSSGFNRTSPKR